jgi:ankyrin repeat protein
MPRLPALVAILIFSAATAGMAETVPPTPALHWAASQGLVDLASLLIEQGASVNSSDWFGNTPLHAGIHYPEVVQLLLDSGARVNARNAFGNTPLHLAVNDRRVVELLIEAGADVRARNYLDKTPLDYALRGGRSAYNLSIVETLIRAGAAAP